jgi:alkylation response protein AidB-like acyl-CoA dehydrogenase
VTGAGGAGADLEAFRAEVVAFLGRAREEGIACPAYGAILPPGLHDRARAWQRHVADHGFAGLHWPVAYGGRGLSRAHDAVWQEECARAQVSPYLNLQGLVLAGEAILRSGTDEQRRRYLPPTLTGEVLWCQLFSEPGAGSDLTGLTTAAVADGDRYVVDGAKVWSSNAQQAEYGILLARTDPARRGHRGISFFLLDMAAPGVTVRPIRQMTGDEEFCEVVLDGVVVPADARLGPEHEGWRVATEVLLDERGSGAAGLVGLERRLAHLRDLAGDDPVRRDALVGLYVRGQALRTLLMRSGGGPAAASSAKLLRTELESDTEVLLATLRGPDAVLAGPATDRFLYAPGMRIAGGTSEIQRNIIAERVLDLPRGP